MNILTFDIEDWFHLLDNPATDHPENWSRFESRIYQNMDKIFGVLDKHNQSATFFCVGWIARKYPDIIKKINNLGYEVATHSDLHQLAYRYTPAEFREDLKRSVESLEELTGKKVRAYRAPGFSIRPDNKWAFEILAEQGIQVDCSVFPSVRAHGGYPDFGCDTPTIIYTRSGNIQELPINLKQIAGRSIIFSGGGYFRLAPKSLLIKWIKQSDYVMTYFHPRDFDPEQPMIPGLSWLRKFKSYYGLANALPKLDAILSEIHFIDVDEALKLINWNKAPIFYA